MDNLSLPVFGILPAKTGIPTIAMSSDSNSFDELKFNPYLETPLTTVRQNQHEIGRHAVEILLSRINQPEEHFSPREVIVPVELVIGKTTRKLPEEA